MPTPEYQFAKDIGRKWRMDWAWPDKLVYLEVDGGLFVNGGHNRGAQMLLTWEKENEASCRGWRVIRCQPKDLLKTNTAMLIKRALSMTPQPTHHHD